MTLIIRILLANSTETRGARNLMCGAYDGHAPLKSSSSESVDSRSSTHGSSGVDTECARNFADGPSDPAVANATAREALIITSVCFSILTSWEFDFIHSARNPASASVNILNRTNGANVGHATFGLQGTVNILNKAVNTNAQNAKFFVIDGDAHFGLNAAG